MGTLSVREVIVVEGKYDRIRLQAAVKATIVETNGFRIFKDPEQRELLRRLGMERGLLVLTDSDAAGFVIRGHLNGLLPPDRIKHAYVPAVAGREKRKTADSKEGLLGVEGMDAATLEAAIRRSGATLLDEEAGPAAGGITKADFYAYGLSGGANAAALRDALAAQFDLPGGMTANALLGALSVLCSREDFEAAARAVQKKFT